MCAVQEGWLSLRQVEGCAQDLPRGDPLRRQHRGRHLRAGQVRPDLPTGGSSVSIRRTLAVFLVGAFLEKRVDCSHGFSSVFFFDTPEVTKIVLPKVLQNFKKTPNCTFGPRELNEKVFFSFFFRVTYNTGRD